MHSAKSPPRLYKFSFHCVLVTVLEVSDALSFFVEISVGLVDSPAQKQTPTAVSLVIGMGC